MTIKLKEIASELGVSPATISRVINDRPGVSEELRMKILEKIDQLNLRPKQRVGGFVKDDTINVNLFVRMNHSAENDPFYSLIQEGIAKELQNHKTNLLFYVLNESSVDHAVLQEMFENKSIDGNILVGADFDPEFLRKIKSYGIPTVLVDNEFEGLSSVNIDNYSGALQAVRHLIDLGHKKVLFLSGPLTHNSILKRFEGYKDGVQKYAADTNPTLIECDGVSVDDGYKAIHANPQEHYTAIFAANDKLAIGALKALKEKGLRVPEDISIIGFDDIEWGIHTEPPLSTVRIPKHQIGVLAAQLFLNLYRNDNFKDIEIKIDAKLIERESTIKVQTNKK